MKKLKKIQMKIVIFNSREKSLYIAWACFRNDLGGILADQSSNMAATSGAMSSICYMNFVHTNSLKSYSLSFSESVSDKDERRSEL